ncbi:hypothetical protein CRYUN_Cryun06bG0067400 [Craigia yunnanensis]
MTVLNVHHSFPSAFLSSPHCSFTPVLRLSDLLFLDPSNGSFCTYLSFKGPLIKWNTNDLWFQGQKWGNSTSPVETDFFQENLYNLRLRLQCNLTDKSILCCHKCPSLTFVGATQLTSWDFNQEKPSWFAMLQIWCPQMSFIRSWVIVGKNAKQSTKAAASNLSFDQQCTHCEKKTVKKGVLSMHGGYYYFIDCTFEKWTLDYKESVMDGKNRVVVKNRSFWC